MTDKNKRYRRKADEMDLKEKEMAIQLNSNEEQIEPKVSEQEPGEVSDNQKHRKRKGGCFKSVTKIFVCLVIICGVFFAGRYSVLTSSGFGTGLNNGNVLRKLSLLEAYTGKYYLNKIDADNVEQNIYKGFAKGLEDPYAEYYTKDEYKQLTEEDSGKYEGIGISVAKDTDTGYAEIISVFKNQPAYKAGLKVGDLIISVNKKSTADMELQDVVSEIKKKENKKVVLTIYRDRKSTRLNSSH